MTDTTACKLILAVASLIIIQSVAYRTILVWSWTSTQDSMFKQTQNCKSFTHSEHDYLFGINCNN